MTVLYESVPLAYVAREWAKQPNEPVFIDFETLGLFGDVVLAQFMMSGWQEALLVEYPDRVKLQELVVQMHAVSYPISYDIGLLEIQPRKIDDLQIASKSAFPLSPDFKLSTICKEFYVGVNKAEMQKSFLKKRQAFTEEQLHYGALDVWALEWLWRQPQIIEVVDHNLSYRVDMKNQMLALDYQHRGMPVIATKWGDAFEKTEAEREDYQTRLNAIVGRELNVKSWKQKQEAFPELPTDSKGKIPTGEPAFKKLYLDTDKEVYKLVMDTTKRRTQLQDLEKYRESYRPEEDPVRIRTMFNVAGAITGRYTSKGGDRVGYTNIQNIGRHFKHIFGYEEGTPRKIISADYGQAELIAAASIHSISAYVEAVLNGDDLHKSGYAKMFKVPMEEVTKEQRQSFKAIAFGLIFGLGVERFQAYAYDNYGVKFSEVECINIKKLYYEIYPEIAKWHKETARKVKASGFTVKTALGRVVHPDRYADALNISIQGSVAEATKMSMNFFVEDYPQLLDKGVLLINMVHDSIVLDCPDELVEEASLALAESMKLGWKELSKSRLFETKLPITVDVDVGLTWR